MSRDLDRNVEKANYLNQISNT